MVIKELSKELINVANNNSFGGKRGDISEHEYKVYAQRILDFPISDEKKQKLLNTLYDKWSKLLSYEAQHVSVAVAGGSNYNAKRLDKSDKVFELTSEIVEWYENIVKQVDTSKNRLSRISSLIQAITWGVSGGYNVTNDWRKLAEISKEDFKKTYETLNEKYPFKKSTVAYKLYHDLDNVQEKKKDAFYDNADYEAYTEGDRAYIKFTLKPKRQLIIALKSRGWWWNAHENAWSTYLDKLDKEWVCSISERYKDYI